MRVPSAPMGRTACTNPGLFACLPPIPHLPSIDPWGRAQTAEESPAMPAAAPTPAAPAARGTTGWLPFKRRWSGCGILKLHFLLDSKAPRTFCPRWPRSTTTSRRALISRADRKTLPMRQSPQPSRRRRSRRKTSMPALAPRSRMPQLPSICVNCSSLRGTSVQC